ncbi:long-chain-alcohol O-fatty-acyltransferase-like protein [Tanacetum coccineum]
MVSSNYISMLLLLRIQPNPRWLRAAALSPPSHRSVRPSPATTVLGVELVLAITAYLTMFLKLGFEIEPQFNEPYLATSLQDFWGRRWNLMVSRILRPTVYDPVREITSPLIGKQYSQLPAIFLTFLVSGLMHELIYVYLTRVWPTWEVTWFFVLHGVCTAVEVAVKKAVNGRFRLHRAVSGLFTVVFVAVTGVWLFLPQILRNGVDVKAIDEYYILVNFLRSIWE